MNIKAGWKTTEFWLSLAAVVAGEVVAVGLVPTEGPWPKVVGLGVGVLAALGYSHSRSVVKTTE